MAKDYAKQRTKSPSRSHQRRSIIRRLSTVFLKKNFFASILVLILTSIIGIAILAFILYPNSVKHFSEFLVKKHLESRNKTQPMQHMVSNNRLGDPFPVRFDFYTELSHDQVVLSKNAPIREKESRQNQTETKINKVKVSISKASVKRTTEPLTTRQLEISMLLDAEYHKKRK